MKKKKTNVSDVKQMFYDELLESANTATPQPPKGQNTMPFITGLGRKFRKKPLGAPEVEPRFLR